MPGIFISYRRGGTSAYAGRLYDRLAGEFGEDNVFMDLTAIDPGTDFVDTIERAVGDADALLVIIGPGWVDASGDGGTPRLQDPRDFVHREVLGALERETLVVPVLVGGATMPEADRLPDPLSSLARRNALELTDAGWSRDVDRLIDALRGRIPHEIVTARPRRRRGLLLLALVGVAATVGAIALIGNDPGKSGASERLEVSADVPVGGYAAYGVVSGGKLWTAIQTEGALKIIRPGSRTPSDSPQLGQDLSGLTAPDGHLFVGDWGKSVEDGRGTVTEVDPAAGRALGRPFPTTEPYEIDSDGRSLWTTDIASVKAIDLETRRVRKVEIDGEAPGVAVNDGTAWVLDADAGELLAFDARTARPRGRPIDVGARPMSVAATDDAVWVATEQGRLVRVGADGGGRRTLTVGGEGRRVVEADGRGVWVIDEQGNVILIDPEGLRVRARTHLEGDLNDIALDRGGAWIVRGRSEKPSTVVHVVLKQTG